MTKKYNIAVVGATGAVGGEFFSILEERKFPIGQLRPLASEDSFGKSVPWGDELKSVEVLSRDSFKDIDIAFFRMEPDVPLVVPEVNPQAIAESRKRNIIANPNCSTIQMVVVLHALAKKAPIKRVVVSTYQSVSGAGIAAMEELSKQTVSLFSNQEIAPSVFPHRIAFNCLPQIDCFAEDDYTKEEQKMMQETKKIMGSDIPVTATCVRVPVFYGHSESVNVEFASEVTPSEAKDLLSKTAGVELVDDVAQLKYPLAVNAQGEDPVFVGRIRRDTTVPHGLNLWIVADNIRKGAALNAVQIAEHWINGYR